MDDREDEARMRRILEPGTRELTPPPFDELSARRSRSSLLGSLTFTAVAVLVAIAALIAGGQLSEFRQRQAASSASATLPAGATASPSGTRHVTLPPVVARPITRTSPAAQVAWVGTYPANQNGAGAYVGIDPSGKIVGRLSTDDGPYWRSADGTQIFAIRDDIRAYSALDGKLARSYGPIADGRAIDAAFSADGRWLAIVGSAAFVQIVDLQTGMSQTTPLGHSASAQHPGLSGNDPGALIWSSVVFSPDSRRVYTLVDWGGPGRLTAFDVTPTGLVQRATAVDRESGKTFAACGGPGLTARVVQNGSTLVTFCYVDAQVSFIDLTSLNTTATFRASMANPFWLAPIFTPDGQLLYLHQYPSFGDVMQVIDLATRTLLGPVPTPKQVTDPGPFAWLFPVAYAGGTPSTVPVSPDGLKLYAVGSLGVTVLRIPDLKPVARLASDIAISEVWVSGDGKTLFGTTNGKTVYVIPENGGAPIKLDLSDQAGYFIASEHG
jgi:hypothetical protein